MKRLQQVSLIGIFSFNRNHPKPYLLPFMLYLSLTSLFVLQNV